VFCENEATPELYQYVAKNIITSAMDGFNGMQHSAVKTDSH